MARNWLWRVTLGCWLCLCPALQAVADDVWLELAGQWGGCSFAVAVEGNVACLGVGPRIVVLDISQPAEPLFLGQTSVLPSEIWEIALVGTYAYVAAGDLYVIDISDPANPAWIGTATAGHLGDVVVRGSYAYGLDADLGLQVFDISDPCTPTWVASCPATVDGMALALADNYAYVLSPYRLYVIDISDPGAPFLVSSTAWNYARDIAVRNGYAYLTTWYPPEHGLEVVDLSNPYLPQTVGFCPMEWDSHAVALAGDYAYVTDDGIGLEVIDISDPDAPSWVAKCDTGGGLFLACVAAAGDFAYMTDTDADHGLLVIDVQDPAAPALVGGYHNVGRAHGVTVAGTHAYVDADGLHIVDVSDPAQPERVAFRTGAGSAAVVGNVAYLAKRYDGLEIVDVSDPAAPYTLGQLATSDCAIDVAIQSHYAYVADRLGGLMIADVADPCAPYWIGACPAGLAWGVDVSGPLAYVADFRDALRVIDVTDPGAPFEVGFCAVSKPRNVHVADQYAYLATYTRGFDIIDVSDPFHPATAGQFTEAWQGEYVMTCGTYAYLASQFGLYVVDVSVPSQPTCAAYTTGRAYGVDVSGGHAYVANDQSGLTILAVHIPGDLDCDGRIAFGDINPFVLALCSPDAYPQTYPQCHQINADINGDGTVDFGDINPFIALLTGR